MPHISHSTLNFPGCWRILSFGRLDANPLQRKGNLSIRVNLGKVEYHGQGQPRSVPGHFKSALVPVGETPRLHFNAILRDGEILPRRFMPQELRKTSALDLSSRNIKVFQRWDKDGSGELIIPRRASAPDWNTEDGAYFLGIGNDGDPFAHIIPCYEVFRFFYAYSSVLAKTVLSDAILDPHNRIWDTDHSSMSPSTGEAMIWLRKWMLDADARFIANLAFDSYALKQAQEIYLSTAVRSATGNDRILKALPPINGDAELTYYATTFDAESGEKRVLINQISSCNWNPPFTHLRWDRDNDSRTGPTSEKSKENPDKPREALKPSQQPDGNIDLRPQPPSHDATYASLHEKEIANRFPQLMATRAEKCPQEETNSEKRRKIYTTIEQAFRGSVNDGQSSHERVGKTIIEGMCQKPLPLPLQADDAELLHSRLSAHLEVLHLLQLISVQEHVEVAFLSVLDDCTDFQGTPFNVFPAEIDDKQKAWLYLDQAKTKRRAALVAGLKFGNRHRYLIELQHRRTGECSTLVVWTEDEANLADGLLHRMLMNCAEEGAARLTTAWHYNLQWGRLHHIDYDLVTTNTVAMKERYATSNKAAQGFLARIFSANPLE